MLSHTQHVGALCCPTPSAQGCVSSTNPLAAQRRQIFTERAAEWVRSSVFHRPSAEAPGSATASPEDGRGTLTSRSEVAFHPGKPRRVNKLKRLAGGRVPARASLVKSLPRQVQSSPCGETGDACDNVTGGTGREVAPQPLPRPARSLLGAGRDCAVPWRHPGAQPALRPTLAMENAARGSGRWRLLQLRLWLRFRLRLHLVVLLGTLVPQVRFGSKVQSAGPTGLGRRPGSRVLRPPASRGGPQPALGKWKPPSFGVLPVAPTKPQPERCAIVERCRGPHAHPPSHWGSGGSTSPGRGPGSAARPHVPSATPAASAHASA